MRKTKKVLLFAVILVVLGSFLASMFHTSFFQVKVKEIEFETDFLSQDKVYFIVK